MAAPVDERTLAELLDDVAGGRIRTDEAVEALRDLPYQDLEHAKVDHHRELRTGQVEAVFAPGKTVEQICEVARGLLDRATGAVLVTRTDRAQREAVLATFPGAVAHERSGLVVVRPARDPSSAAGRITVVTGGTSDAPVAEEAAATAEALGHVVHPVADVGVAGVHRVIERRADLESADCVVVIAGMEGALASVVAGLVSSPVVAVPTSVGYGASFEGLAALLGMLSSCAPGVSVVNIDNGFGAAQVADRIVRASRRNDASGATRPTGAPSPDEA